VSGGTEVPHGTYTEVRYQQFQPRPALDRARRLAGLIARPLVWPLARLSRRSDVLFRTVSEFLSLLPYMFGVVLRGEFYRYALRRCGRNVLVEFGTVFLYADVSVGDHVLIGRYNIIHHCDFGSYVLTAEGCSFLSGSRYHRYDLTDVPMALQGGFLKRIAIGDDCWIGAHAVVMEDVARGSIVGAASVVTRPVEEMTIVAGNPARVVRRRTPNSIGDAPPARSAIEAAVAVYPPKSSS
jgi:acetyltransferase-like isoleucine patch superfamily enzyme